MFGNGREDGFRHVVTSGQMREGEGPRLVANGGAAAF
jgi:hypothetical protein